MNRSIDLRFSKFPKLTKPLSKDLGKIIFYLLVLLFPILASIGFFGGFSVC